VPVVLQKENVKTLPRDVFDRVDQLTAPRLVEYWEQDPCPRPRPEMEMPAAPMAAALGMARAAPSMAMKAAVRIEAQFTVGEYDIVVLSATDSSALDAWLRQNHYKIPAGAEPYLRPYVQMGMKFFVAKVDVSKVTYERVGNGPEQAVLSPLRFHYDSDAFRLPIRLGLINSAGTQDIVVTILAREQRYEVANYDNVAIPTNIDVSDSTRGSFASFYAALFDDTARKHPHAVVTEYSWAANSCDPCPTPPLQANDLMTLGADVLASAGSSAPMNAPILRPAPVWQDTNGFVITRLHARYTKDALGDDLSFRTADPIAGGREFLQSAGKLEQGAQAASMNNFQARYAIRHPWTGPIACKEPRRGIWGGPPGSDPWSGGPTPAAKAAAKIGFVPRSGMPLAGFVRGALPPESLLTRHGPVLASPQAARWFDAGIQPGDAAAGPDGSPESPPDMASPGAPPSPPPAPPAAAPTHGGCAGCSTGAGDGTTGALAALVAIALAGFRRNWRRASPSMPVRG
jgi:MYXO-CTERM domain-containing protein